MARGPQPPRRPARESPLLGLALVAPSLLGALVSSCGGEPAEPPRLESGAERRARRTGVLRDLVLVPRPARSGGPYFLDRFETTRLDWHRWDTAQRLAAVEAGPPPRPPDGRDATLPIASVSLLEARQYARWRLCRLPRADELLHAATGGGQYAYPWGDLRRDSWGNTGVLGYGAPTPVGTFESGRQRGGAYDLRGNLAEWTEAPSPLHLVHLSRRTVAPALATIWPRGVPLPLSWQLEGGTRPVPRLALGENLHGGIERDLLSVGQQLLADLRGPRAALPRPEHWEAKLLDDTASGMRYVFELPVWGRSSRVGIRLAADPGDLLRHLLREPAMLPAEQLVDVQRFVQRHRALFDRAWADAAAEVGEPGPVLGWLRGALRR